MESTAEPVRITPMAQRFRGYLPVVVDVETGGFDWNRHALLEMAAVPLDLDENGLLVCGETASVHLHPAPGTEIEAGPAAPSPSRRYRYRSAASGSAPAATPTPPTNII